MKSTAGMIILLPSGMRETQFTAQCVLTERGKLTLKTIRFNVHTATA